jgi:5S rRNA maturation endonuclease (ribonuclease M5)
VEINGGDSRYVDPDRNYIIYSYRNKMGFIRTQEMRHRFKPKDDPKAFVQRMPMGAAWDYHAGPPMLYNLDNLQIASTVFMVEGPKDCETIGRHVHDHTLVATTTGAAGTWVDHLAEDLIGKRVVLMPDNDAAGERYADAIAESLTKRGITFTRISFAEDGVNDVSDYLATHTIRELLDKIGEWFIQPEPEPVVEA